MKLISEETLAYYQVKPLMPRRLQNMLRSMVAKYKRYVFQSVWPIDPEADTAPPGFSGWPDGRRFSVVLTHDVNTSRGGGEVRTTHGARAGVGLSLFLQFHGPR